MSMPEFPKPNPDLTQEQALTMILSSIALEEVALSHIINAEGEKIQCVLNQLECGDGRFSLQGLLEVNRSVSNLLDIVLQNQLILKNKMDRVLEYLPKPPCPPDFPCVPGEDCGSCTCCPFRASTCFGIVPRVYGYNDPLLLTQRNDGCDLPAGACPCSKIELPGNASFLINFCAELAEIGCSTPEVELVIACRDRNPIRVPIELSGPSCPPTLFIQTVLQMPCSCTPCHASVFVRTLEGLDLRQGSLCFTKL
ncbi:MAG: hypothetical protein GXX99_02040 [Clostridiales bacterium]|nr:hypothetical protein [Clostridiales bacterium]